MCSVIRKPGDVGGTRVPCAPSEGGAGRAEVKASGSQKSRRVEIRACPHLRFRPPRVDAGVPSRGAPRAAERAGGWASGSLREPQSRASKGGDRRRGTLDLERLRGPLTPSRTESQSQTQAGLVPRRSRGGK